MLTDWKTLVTSESSSTCDEMIENSACVQSNNKGCLASTGSLKFWGAESGRTGRSLPGR